MLLPYSRFPLPALAVDLLALFQKISLTISFSLILSLLFPRNSKERKTEKPEKTQDKLTDQQKDKPSYGFGPAQLKKTLYKP